MDAVFTITVLYHSLHSFWCLFHKDFRWQVFEELNTVCLTIITWFNNLFSSPTVMTDAFLKISKISKISDIYRKNHDIFDIFDILIFSKIWYLRTLWAGQALQNVFNKSISWTKRSECEYCRMTNTRQQLGGPTTWNPYRERRPIGLLDIGRIWYDNWEIHRPAAFTATWSLFSTSCRGVGYSSSVQSLSNVSQLNVVNLTVIVVRLSLDVRGPSIHSTPSSSPYTATSP